jgi:hypothetical protein
LWGNAFPYNMTMRTAQLLLAASILLLGAGCARPEYWVKGLTLPPGSTIVSRAESNTEIEGEKTQPDQSDGTLTIYFNSTASWEQVTAHIGDALAKQGFTETTRELGDLAGFASKVPGLDKMMTASHSYTKEGSGYYVMLNNSKALSEVMDKVLSKIKGKRDKPKGEYMLMVVKNSTMKGGSGDMTPTPPTDPGK